MIIFICFYVFYSRFDNDINVNDTNVDESKRELIIVSNYFCRRAFILFLYKQTRYLIFIRYDLLFGFIN